MEVPGEDPLVSGEYGARFVKAMQAKSADGRPQAWFDPKKPVRLTFTAVDQPSVEHAGVLPLSHSVVLGEREFRFLVQAGRRGFVLVTAEDCAYP